MNSLNTFLSQSFKHFLRVGAFFPSSNRLAERMVRGINGRIIVELGPGTGVITKEILKRMPSNARLISIENNPVFIDYLRKNINDPRLEICDGNAYDLRMILAGITIEKADCIVSGLPLGIFTKSDRMKLLTEISDCLSGDGTLIQFEYFLSGIKTIKSFFKKISLSYEIWNLPPAFVMRCKKNKK